MKAAIVKIGNSRGIRIPKPILTQCGFEQEVELEVHDNQLVVRSTRQTREGWGEAFKSMSQQGDDVLIDEIDSSWDSTEWEWK